MGLFDLIAGAIADPSQQASPDGLGSILGTVQQLGNNYGIDAATTQTALSIVGNHARSALQQQRATGGEAQALSIVNQFSGTTPNPLAVAALFPPQLQTRVIQEISQRTGLDAGTIQSMLPMLIPVVLNFLKMGANTQNSQQGANPVLNSFLDADGDGDVDIADAMQMAGRYMNQSR